MRKPAFCICENKDADQLRGYLCFRPIDSAIPLLSKSELSNFWSSSVAVEPGFCRTWSENPNTGFLTTRPIFEPLLELREHNFTLSCVSKYSVCNYMKTRMATTPVHCPSHILSSSRVSSSGGVGDYKSVLFRTFSGSKLMQYS